jgi:hypothetical protein
MTSASTELWHAVDKGHAWQIRRGQSNDGGTLWQYFEGADKSRLQFSESQAAAFAEVLNRRVASTA